MLSLPFTVSANTQMAAVLPGPSQDSTWCGRRAVPAAFVKRRSAPAAMVPVNTSPAFTESSRTSTGKFATASATHAPEALVLTVMFLNFCHWE